MGLLVGDRKLSSHVNAICLASDLGCPHLINYSLKEDETPPIHQPTKEITPH